MITLDRLDEEKRERVIAPLRHLADAMVVEDTGSILEFIDVGLPVCRGGPLGCIGYCMGGRHVSGWLLTIQAGSKPRSAFTAPIW